MCFGTVLVRLAVSVAVALPVAGDVNAAYLAVHQMAFAVLEMTFAVPGAVFDRLLRGRARARDGGGYPPGGLRRGGGRGCRRTGRRAGRRSSLPRRSQVCHRCFGSRALRRPRAGRLNLRLHALVAESLGDGCVGGDEPRRVGPEDSDPQVRGGGRPGREEADRRERSRRERAKRHAGGQRRSCSDRLDDGDERQDGRRTGPSKGACAAGALDPVETTGELGHDDLEAERIERTSADLAVLHAGCL
jgi:hypothetical protein